MHMVAPSVKQAVYLSKQGIPVYQYHFSKKPSWHSIELNYIFGSPFTSKNQNIASIEFNYNGVTIMAYQNLNVLHAFMKLKYNFTDIYADEIGNLSGLRFTERDKAYSRLAMRLWTNFAKYG